MQLNKYDLAEWVVNIIGGYHIQCRNCLFKCENKSPKCWTKKLLMEEIVKKYNL